jgi:hypothetical protein
MLKLIILLWIITGNLLATPASRDIRKKPGSFAEAEKRYGKLYWDYSWEQKKKWLTPFNFKDINPNFKTAYINRDMSMAMMVVMAELKERNMLYEITSFNGCYNPRGVRGKRHPSTHAYGLGCDFNAFGGPGTEFTAEFVNVWERWGFCWGGRFSNRDPMHFSYSWECRTNKEGAVIYD